jgi:glycerol-3-phosphate dehydrogenase
MRRDLPPTLLTVVRRLARVLIRVKIWIPLARVLDLIQLAQEWRYKTDEAKRQLVLKRVNRQFADVGIDVRVRDGIVHLNGSAETWNQIVALGLLAGRKVPGVRGVVNHVSSPETHGQRATEADSKHRRNQLDDVDICIIGAGVSGCAIARELSKYELSVAVVEKASDVSTGQTKANNGMIHPAVNPRYGSLMQKLNLRGNRLYPMVCQELGVPYWPCGMIGVVTDPGETPLIELIYIKGKLNGESDMRILSTEELARMEPNLSKEVYGGLYSGTTGVVRPYEIALAYAENAAENGVRFHFNAEVTGIERAGDSTEVKTSRGLVRCGLLINAAGIAADRMAKLAGSEEFTLHPRRGELIVFDKDTEGYVKHVIGEMTLKKSSKSKGGGIMVSVDGNILFGPSATDCVDRSDKSTHAEAIVGIIDKFTRLVPDFPTHKVIATFAGVRAATYTEDFIIRFATYVPNLIHVAGIQSPGLASAPAIAEMVEGLVLQALPGVEHKKDWKRRREPRVEFARLPEAQKNNLIAEDPGYAHIVCRCEGVTEREVRDACRGPLGANTTDGIKRRTRAGMGRCQGGFCVPYVAKIISEEHGITLASVTKDGPGSELFSGRTKEVA